MDYLGHHAQVECLAVVVLGCNCVFIEWSRSSLPSQKHVLIVVETVGALHPVGIPAHKLSVRLQPGSYYDAVAVHPVANKGHTDISRAEAGIGYLHIALHIARHVVLNFNVHFVRNAYPEGITSVGFEPGVRDDALETLLEHIRAILNIEAYFQLRFVRSKLLGYEHKGLLLASNIVARDHKLVETLAVALFHAMIAPAVAQKSKLPGSTASGLAVDVGKRDGFERYPIRHIAHDEAHSRQGVVHSHRHISSLGIAVESHSEQDISLYLSVFASILPASLRHLVVKTAVENPGTGIRHLGVKAQSLSTRAAGKEGKGRSLGQ